MRRLISIPGLVLFLNQLQAQSISRDEPEKIFSERVFIHTDRSGYLAGDTVWFKAYLFNDNFPGSASTNFYIDLINEKGLTIDSKKLPVVDGTVYGNFSLPDTLVHGFYFLRAYTRMLVSQGNKDGVIKSIAVINPDNIPAEYRSDALYDYRINFFPESGSLVRGFLNSVIFKTTDQYGKGIPANGYLFNSAGDTITHFKDIREGLGMFSFTPEGDERYFAEIVFTNRIKKKYDLPAALSQGILLRVAENAKGKIFQVQKTNGMGLQDNLDLTGFMFNKVVFRETLQFSGNSANGVIPLSNLPEGVLNLAVMDNNNKVYAKRPVFIYHPDIKLPLLLKTDTLSFLSKAKNSFTLTFPDSAEGNFSVSVIACDEKSAILSNNTITSSILWDAEKENLLSIRSFEIDNPDKQTRTINDLLLVTEKQKPLQDIDNAKKEIKENYIQISGKVFKEGTSKQVIEGELLFMIQTKDSATTFIRSAVQKDGSFILNNLVFDDTAKFYYKRGGKKTAPMEIKLNEPEEAFRIKSAMPSFTSLLPVDKLIISDSSLLKELAEQKKLLTSSRKSKMLKEVIVTSRVKRPVDIVNKKYTGGLFSSMNASVFDFVNEPPKPGSQRILDYLMGKVAGLWIQRRNASYIVTSTRAMSITGGRIPVQIFLNEMPIEPDMLFSLTVSDVALVKYFRAGSNMMAGFGLSGKLAIYTKNPEDFNFSDVSDLKVFSYKGYNAVRDFIPKDYSTINAAEKDNRTTLYWNPNANLLSGDNEFKIQFYNSDDAKKFKVVVQGFTYDGRLIDFEKIIE